MGKNNAYILNYANIIWYLHNVRGFRGPKFCSSIPIQNEHKPLLTTPHPHPELNWIEVRLQLCCLQDGSEIARAFYSTQRNRVHCFNAAFPVRIKVGLRASCSETTHPCLLRESKSPLSDNWLYRLRFSFFFLFSSVFFPLLLHIDAKWVYITNDNCNCVWHVSFDPSLGIV